MLDCLLTIERQQCTLNLSPVSFRQFWTPVRFRPSPCTCEEIHFSQVDGLGFGLVKVSTGLWQAINAARDKTTTDTLFGRATSGIGGFFTAPAQEVRSFAMAA